MPTPTSIRLRRAERLLDVEFDDGAQFSFPAEYLRVESPSAEVQGHAPDQRRVVPGKRGVVIEALEPVGNYAVRIRFSDGHDTGLYSWDWLHRIGTEREERWQAYLNMLDSKGMSRDR